ncbi:hypothetical protein ADIS_2537 [Lunatimonas lonarensis]|uniref:Uncharacterized protein n=1 Tax=Lunatimonas lonarensis TaxID=1232681 RepID=R7ZSK1_9BACT|nr:hypothetical protein [Lunatimonas lonarensis]EON76994.1 hypothetical protein ADIS_2537 [Lunatimonas lonarensis]
METVYYFIQTLAFVSLSALVAGMVRPVTVLWFHSVVNRLGVLRYYGVATLVFFGLGFLIKLLFLTG